MKLSMLSLSLTVCLLGSPQAWAVPAGLNFQGRIVKADGTPLEYAGVTFIIQILNPAGTCVLYKEQRANIDMRGSQGLFDVTVGDGSRVFPGSGSIMDILKNRSGLPCEDGSTYNAAVTDGRLLRFQFNDGGGLKTVAPDNLISSVPYAGFSDSALKVGDSAEADLVRKADVPVCSSGSLLTSSSLGQLTCVTSGSAIASAGVSYRNLVNTSGVSPWPATSCSAGQFLVWDSATDTFSCSALTSSHINAALGVTPVPDSRSVLAGTGLVGGGTLSGDVTLNVDVGTTANKILRLDSAGRIPSSVMPQTYENAAWTESGGDVHRLTGNLGLGTASPVNKIDIVDSDKSVSIGITNTLSTGLRAPGYWVKHFSGGTTGGPAMTFYTIAGSQASPSPVVANRTLGVISASGGSDTTGATVRGAVIRFLSAQTFSPTASGTGIIFETAKPNTTAVQERARISADGRLGVGLTNPSTAITVAGNRDETNGIQLPETAVVRIQRADTTNGDVATLALQTYRGIAVPATQTLANDILGQIRFEGRDTVNLVSESATSIQAYAAENFTTTAHGSGLVFKTVRLGTANGTESMRIAPSGNVGIGVSNPMESLSVLGNISVDSTYDCILGNASGSVSCSSDQNLKKNIKVIPDALEKVLKIRGVEFDWNERSQAQGRHDIGVIAQEIEKQFPTVVHRNPATGFKMVDYGSLVAPLIEAVKALANQVTSLSDKQDAEIIELKSAVQSLIEENQKLRQRVDSLEKR